MKEYNKSNIPLARELRKNMTPWERKLWYQYLSTYPVRFQRQKAIGDYIVDFYCAKSKMAIELDGGGHYYPDQMQKDELRTHKLQELGVRVVRICNLDIDQNFVGVCEFLNMEIQKSLPQSAALTHSLLCDCRRQSSIQIASLPSSEGACRQRTPGKKIYALGFFDGVHLGHQALLAAARELAGPMDAGTAAITFDRHPTSLFTPTPPALINSIDDRRQLLRAMGMDQILVLPVTQEVMSTPWEDFLDGLLAMGAAGFVCGDDFHFGHKGRGDAKNLENYCRQRNLPCVIIPEQQKNGIRVSSTHIRSLIEEGRMEEAAAFLGHGHILSGEVVPGRQLGRTIGVPTANILIPEGVVVPKLGVYGGTCRIDGRDYTAVTNIGFRPTVGGHQIRAESWILDFEGDLYGRHITLEFCHFLRPEEKFDTLAALQAQISRDADEARKRKEI